MLKAKNSNYLLAFIVIEILFILTFPANRTEADDGFWFATDVRDKSLSELFNPRFPFYLPFSKIIISLIRLIGFDIDVYVVMSVISAVFAGLIIILLYDILINIFDIPVRWSVGAVGLLLFSYEYWRYAMEAEVYMIATFFLLVSLKQYFVLRSKDNWAEWLKLIIVSALAILFYKPSFIPVFLCFPFILLNKERLKALVGYYAISGFLLLGVFFLIYSYADVSAGSFIEYITKGAKQSPGSAIMIAIVIASNFISIQWLFSFDQVQQLISRYMPHKAIEEELYLAKTIGFEKNVVLILTLLTVIGVLILIYLIIRKWRSRIVIDFRPYWPIILWVVIYGGFLGFFDPTSNEPWLMIQVPLIIIIIAVIASNYQLVFKMFTSIVTLAFIINLVGGLMPLKDKAHDLNYIKTQWLSENTGVNDYILSYGPISLIRYLDYNTDASIINLEEKIGDGFDVLKNSEIKRENIYFTHDFISPPKAIMFRSGDQIKSMEDFMSTNQLILAKVDSSAGFYTYRLKPKNSYNTR